MGAGDRKRTLVLKHQLCGSPLPVDWCPLGGAERFFLLHWLPSPRTETAIDEREYCVVCGGVCTSGHVQLDQFHRQLRTLTRDTPAPLDNVELFSEMVWGLIESKCFLGATVEPRWRSSGEFPRQLLNLWRRGKGRVPGRGEVWIIAKQTGVSTLFAGTA